MTKTSLHFAHANSYPTGTYRVFLGHLKKHYEVQALPIHAHNPAYPVANGWQALARELSDDLSMRHVEPVVLMGHSMGGVLSLMVAKSHPELVRCVVLLDAPIVAGWRATLLRIAKQFGMDKRCSPAQFSARRRNTWSDAQAAYEHYAAKALFAAWPQEVLKDYLHYGLARHADGVTLRFTRETETAVYRSLPHHIGTLVRRDFPVPVGFIGGVDSIECRQAGLGATRRLVGRHFTQVQGGHLFPLESPESAANAAHDMIQALLSH